MSRQLSPNQNILSISFRTHVLGPTKRDFVRTALSSHGEPASSASAIFLSLGARMEPMMSCSGCCSSSGVQSTARSERPAKMTLKSGSPRASVLWVEHMMKATRSRACSAHRCRYRCIEPKGKPYQADLVYPQSVCRRMQRSTYSVYVSCTCSIHAVCMQCICSVCMYYACTESRS